MPACVKQRKNKGKKYEPSKTPPNHEHSILHHVDTCKVFLPRQVLDIVNCNQQHREMDASGNVYGKNGLGDHINYSYGEC